MPKPLLVDELDNTPLTFGKYKGRTPIDIAEENPKYLIWAHDTVRAFPVCSRQLRDYCEQDERDDEEEYALDIHYGKDGW